MHGDISWLLFFAHDTTPRVYDEMQDVTSIFVNK